jgi:hypothetical protein
VSERHDLLVKAYACLRRAHDALKLAEAAVEAANLAIINHNLPPGVAPYGPSTPEPEPQKRVFRRQRVIYPSKAERAAALENGKATP